MHIIANHIVHFYNSDQSSHILGKVTTSATDIQETRQLVLRTTSLQAQTMDIIKTGEESLSQKLDFLGQDAIEGRELLGQSLASTSRSVNQVKDELSALRRNVSDSATLSSSRIEAAILDHHIELTSRLEASNDGLREYIRNQVFTNRVEVIQDVRNELSALLATTATQQNPLYSTDLINTGNSVFDINLRRGTARLEASSRQAQPELEFDKNAKHLMYSRPLRCKCRAGASTTRWAYGPVGLRLETQAVPSCPIHGKKRGWSFSVEAKLSPFLRGTLDLTLGLICGTKGCEIARPLTFKSTVKRSESPIFQLFDRFIETWGTLRPFEPCRSTGQLVTINSSWFGLSWDEELLSKGFSHLIHGIVHSIESNQASGSDVDEHGRTLLMVSN